LGNVANCNSCGTAHHPLLNEALAMGWAIIVQEVGGGLDQVHLCSKDIKVEVVGRGYRLYGLHDWGTTQTFTTHAVAGKVGLVLIRHLARLVSGLGGACLESTYYFMVPIVDYCDVV
jgi:hypothetical protein